VDQTTSPLFVDVVNFDLHLSASSPCIGAAMSLPEGVPSNLYTRFPLLYQPRLQSNGFVERTSAVDIGAMEYVP
jgi:hypothetical protein